MLDYGAQIPARIEFTSIKIPYYIFVIRIVSRTHIYVYESCVSVEWKLSIQQPVELVSRARNVVYARAVTQSHRGH